MVTAVQNESVSVPGAEEQKVWLTVPEVVEILPAPIAAVTVYKWAREGRFRTLTLGSKIFILADSVAEFIKSGLDDGK